MNVETDETDILSFFPLEKPRASQKAVLKEIDKAFASGKRLVLLEAPVGSGKSPIAITMARKFGSSHIITPRKSLQDQYFEDFSEDLVLMKGRNAYPCILNASDKVKKSVIKNVQLGKIKTPTRDEDNCANAPCRNNKLVYDTCSSRNPCPYSTAIEVAQNHHTIVHNVHSFIFQTNFGDKFQQRKLMVIDEAHEIEDALRGFIAKKFTLNHVLTDNQLPVCETVDQWCDFFSKPEFLPELTDLEISMKESDPTFVTALEKYMLQVESLRSQSEYYNKDFTVKKSTAYSGQKKVGISFEFIPHSLGNAAQRYLFDYGEKILLMSGTIYDKDQFCKYLGINPDDAYFIRVPSTFPVKNRPIFAKSDYQVDTSHRNWADNFQEMVDKINKVLTIFKDVKGLIHVPSYDAGYEIAACLPERRVMTHDRHNLQERLEQFYASDQPLVFISPVCQQGVDFKEDRARFQIITRIPYLNTGDDFVEKKVQNDFPWYNYKALVVFGQQIGRVNRSESDYGATFLLDERFNRFIAKNSRKLPKWLKDAIIYK